MGNLSDLLKTSCVTKLTFLELDRAKDGEAAICYCHPLVCRREGSGRRERVVVHRTLTTICTCAVCGSVT